MSGSEWIIVAAAIVGGVVLGLVVSRVINMALGAPSRPKPIQEASGPLASLGFWTMVIIGLLIALGVISPSALEELPKDIVAFLPRLLSAAIIVIAANVLAAFANAALSPALARAPMTVQRQVAMVTRTTIIGLGVLLAIRQLGIDTTVINLGLAAIFFGIAASLTLLVGLGGREVATEVASTRAVKRILHHGDRITLSDVRGRVVAVHPTAVEIEDDQGETRLVPSSRLLAETMTVERAEAGPEPVDGGPPVDDSAPSDD